MQMQDAPTNPLSITHTHTHTHTHFHQTQVDVADGIKRNLEVLNCGKCGRWHVSGDHWMHMELESVPLMQHCVKKMALDKKNRGASIRCTIVTDIGVSLTHPQPVDKQLIQDVMAESMAAGQKLEAWAPHEGRVAVAAAGGQMAA